jgi:hypothetical protein
MNRQDRCKFKESTEVNAQEIPASSSETSDKRIFALESEVLKLNSVLSELKSVVSNSSVQKVDALRLIGYNGMRVILMNRNAQMNEVEITKDEPWRLISTPTSREYVSPPSQPIFPDRDEIYKVLSVYKPPILIGPVAGFLVDYFTCKNTAITNFRVSIFKGPTQHHDPDWLMLQWDESELKYEVFALFKVNTKAGLSSVLVHTGHGSRQRDGQRWAHSLLSWWVLTMEDLKELLVAGRQVLGVMNWADQEMVEKFFDPAQTDCSIQE